ncbi:MAG: helix-turn-helix domain-containing protein [Planctomycetaceae bacterium]|nr:helix-turn-helix domain-containing protein [Planctomycetaceae bacterium]
MRKSTHTAEYRALCQHIVAMRKAAGLTQRGLARRLSVPPSWVAKVEIGERRLDLVEYCWICDACEIEPSASIRSLLEDMRTV